MAGQEPIVVPPDFAGRLQLAMDVAGKTQSRTERESGLQGKGRVFRLLGKGKNPILSPGPEVIRILADYLGVAYEWLAIGRGPMHPEGWAPSTLEEAQLIARKHGGREDAIAAVADRFRDAGDMTVMDWLMEFDGEARRLARAGAPRPEVVAKRQGQHRRAAARKKRQDKADGDERARKAAELAAKRETDRTRRGGAA